LGCLTDQVDENGQVLSFPDNPSEARAADAELVGRCVEGDLAAFDRLVARHENRVSATRCG